MTTTSAVPKIDPLIGTVLDEKYRIDSKIGSGGMGAVYKGFHLLLERTVAIKVLRPALAGVTEDDEFLKRFEREARTSSKMNHPNAVAVFDFGIENGFPFLVMEFSDGVSLKTLLESEGRIPFERMLLIIDQVCSALDEAHSLGIIHRDLKPDNIIVSKLRDGSERAVVLDFGIAKMLSDNSPNDVTLTKVGGLMGTPQYMSPEQALGKEVDARSDVYSLGIIAYEMLTGDVPFKADSTMQIILKHMNEVPVRITEFDSALEVPTHVVDAVHKALEKAPENRPQSASAFAKSLRGLDATSSKTQAHTSAITPSKGLPKSLIGIFALILLSAVGAFVALTSSENEPVVEEIAVAEQNAIVQIEETPPAPAVTEEVIAETAPQVEPQAEFQAVTPVEEAPPVVEAPVIDQVELAKRFESALALHKSKKHRQAKEGYLKVLELDVNHARSLANIGDIEITLGNLTSATEALQKSVTFDATNALAFTNLGYAFGELKKFEESLEAYKKAQELNPTSAMARNNLGYAYFKLEQFENAVEQYKESIRLDPKYVRAYYNLGDAYKALGQWERVVPPLKLAVSFDTNNLETYMLLGEAYEKLGEHGQAVSAYTKVLRLNKDYAPAHKKFSELTKRVQSGG